MGYRHESIRRTQQRRIARSGVHEGSTWLLRYFGKALGKHQTVEGLHDRSYIVALRFIDAGRDLEHHLHLRGGHFLVGYHHGFRVGVMRDLDLLTDGSFFRIFSLTEVLLDGFLDHSRSMSPTTISAMLSGRYQAW